MTANQINYVKHLEDVRSHRANEEIAARQAAASEVSAESSASQAVSASRNAETNVLNSETNRISAEASQMSALASQTMAAASMMNAQTERMYKEAQVLLEQAKTEESKRHNFVTESNDLLGLQMKSDIAAADRNERAREADQSVSSTRRGQNIDLGLGIASKIIDTARVGSDLFKTGASLLKPFSAGWNAAKSSIGG